MNFQQIILIIAIVLLIISLIVIGLAITNPTGGNPWPPSISTCPDYWITQNGTSICANVHNLGNELPQCKTADFSGQQYTGANGNCAKKTWAGTCNVEWDGITYGYGNTNPCAAPATTN